MCGWESELGAGAVCPAELSEPQISPGCLCLPDLHHVLHVKELVLRCCWVPQGFGWIFLAGSVSWAHLDPEEGHQELFETWRTKSLLCAPRVPAAPGGCALPPSVSPFLGMGLSLAWELEHARSSPGSSAAPGLSVFPCSCPHFCFCWLKSSLCLHPGENREKARLSRRRAQV